MKISLTIGDLPRREKIKSHFRQKSSKIEQYLKRFEGDLVHLHGALEKNPHKEEFYASLSLYLPSATLHCREEGGDFVLALNSAFLDLARQIKRHKAKLNREKRRLKRHPLKGRKR